MDIPNRQKALEISGLSYALHRNYSYFFLLIFHLKYPLDRDRVWYTNYYPLNLNPFPHEMLTEIHGDNNCSMIFPSSMPFKPKVIHLFDTQLRAGRGFKKAQIKEWMPQAVSYLCYTNPTTSLWKLESLWVAFYLKGQSLRGAFYPWGQSLRGAFYT